MFRRVHVVLLTTLLIAAGACTDSRPTLGEAYVAPATLRLRTDLASKNANGASLKHGDHLDIVDVQRRLVLVRTDKGVQGWVDATLLLSTQQMDLLKLHRRQQAKLPAQGSATAYEVLNVHLDPDRQSPAFTQIPEGGAVTILGHTITARSAQAPRTSVLVAARPQTMTRKQRRDQQSRSSSFRLPPKPPAPKPPANWLKLSAERIDGSNDEDPEPQKPVHAASKPDAPKPPVLDSWTLIRTNHNETGWVLTRNLLMSIPDEVAQYAEGKRITSFFDLGVVQDEIKGAKHNWLWTTGARALTFDFDAWRVFLWNARRHRYETSYRKRDLEGRFPVHVDPADEGYPIRTFQIITKDDDDKLRRRSYSFDGHLVHLVNTEDYTAEQEGAGANQSAIDTDGLASKLGKAGWLKRQWLNLKQRFGW